MTDAPVVLAAEGVSKGYPGVRALDDVSLHVHRGEVLAVVGENGAGKSTLMKALAGIVRPDAGSISVDGAPVQLDSVRAAAAHGIALIHQELLLAENLDAGANVLLGREPRRLGWLDARAAERAATDALERVGADFSASTPVADLSLGRRQLVEIARALSLDARVIIMDEPTSSLSARETDKLFEVVRDLTARGVAVVYISHRLAEVLELADRAVVLRDGRNAGELARSELSHDALVRHMVGRALEAPVRSTSRAPRAPLLEVRGLVTPAHPAHRVDLDVGRGEIVGLAGLVGAGRSELLQALFGIEPALAGTVTLDGEAVALEEPRDALRAGIGLVPEDRKDQALFLDWAVAANVSIATLDREHARGLVRSRRERDLVGRMTGELAVKTPTLDAAVGTLSGGNQQKVVLARWLALEPRLLLLDEPTRGIDVGARQEIYALLRRLAAGGVGILFASSEMEEVLQLADRVVVLREGERMGSLEHDAIDEEAVMSLATGAGR